ncbi:MAG: hypothetical protein J6V69_00620 [Clostridia bacterium]|nr:hypothetical protein [Clostridia bacterium]
MKKTLLTIGVTLLLVLSIVGLVACAGNDDPADSTQNEGPNADLLEFEGITFEDLTVDYDGNVHTITCKGLPDGASVNYTNNSQKEDGVYNAKAVVSKEGYKTKTYEATLTINLAPERVVEARKNSVDSAQQNYDFNINLAGSIYGVAAQGNYDGSYRYNADTQDLTFKRVTSGSLLYDAIEYIYNTGSSKVKLNANEDGVVKRMSVVPQEDEALNLLNIPFSALVNHIDPNNLTNIKKVSRDGYTYKANLALASNNTYVQTLFTILGGLGSEIEIKDVSFSNPAAGIDFYFNMNEDKTLLTGFKYEANVSFPVKGIPITLTIKYAQNDNNSVINVPSTAGLISTTAGITSELNVINGAISALKNSSAYSLDFEARNEFDPGMTTNAIVDKYIARMYKNTNGGRVDFNHSYEYKAHSETDGAETYKYTIGNIQDGSAYMVSRKGSNEITALNNVSANSQFDYMFGAAMVNASDVDCIAKETKDGKVFYYIYTKTAKTLSIKDTITDIINSNEATGVVDVNNYFNNTKNEIKDSEIVVEMEAGAIVNISVKTKIKYVPTAGEYSEDKITLTNSMELSVNEKLEDAQEYEAPKNTETSILGGFGLNNTKYYIG